MALSLAVIAPCGLLVGCTGADNPKLPDVPPSTAKADTEIPKNVGASPYGASRKYQDSMTRDK